MDVQSKYLHDCHPNLMDPEARKIDLVEVFDADAVKVQWLGSTNSGMIGTLVVSKRAIQDPTIIEWIENRELYEIWESE